MAQFQTNRIREDIHEGFEELKKAWKKPGSSLVWDEVEEESLARIEMSISDYLAVLAKTEQSLVGNLKETHR